MEMKHELFIVGLDLETGGLNEAIKQDGKLIHGASVYPIIEIGICVMDTDLKTIDKFDIGIWNKDTYLEMGEYARNMHEKSGLIEELKNKNGGHTAYFPDNSTAEAFIIDRLRELGIGSYNRKARTGGIMLGNSINFDRDFLKFQMPMLNDYFHYRNYDVTPVELALGFMSQVPVRRFQKRYQHRALLDIEESILEARHYQCELSPKKPLMQPLGKCNDYETAIEWYFRASYRHVHEPDREPVIGDEMFATLCTLLLSIPDNCLSPYLELLNTDLLQRAMPSDMEKSEYPMMVVPRF